MSSASPRPLTGYHRLLSALRVGGRRSLFTGGFWAICDQAAISLASFLATVILGHSCKPEELGVYTLAVGGFWVLIGIPNALIWIPYTSRVPHISGIRKQRYSGSVLAHLGLLLGVVAMVLGLGAVLVPWLSHAAAPWIHEWFAYELPAFDRFTTVCLAMIPFTLLMMVREHMRRMLTAQLRMQELIRVDLPIVCMQIGLLWLLADWGKLTAETALLAIGAACSLSVLSLAIRYREFSFKRPMIIRHFAYNYHFGYWLVLGSITWMLSEYSYRLLLSSFHGLDQLGRMAAALYIVLLVNPLLVSICYFIRALIAKRLAESGTGGMQLLVRRISYGMAAVFGVAFLILAFVGDDFVTLVYGEDYAVSNLVVVALCVAMFFRAVIVPVDAALMAMRSGRQLALAGLGQLILAVSFGIPLIYWFGAVGAGCAMAVSDCGSLILRWYFFQNSEWSKTVEA